MNIGRLKTTPFCPACQKPLDGWSHEGDETPVKGDITVCLYCSKVLEFGRKMRLKPATAEAIAECDFLELQNVYAVVAKIQAQLKLKKPKRKPH